MITQQYLLDKFHYDPLTGVFKRKATGHVYTTTNKKYGYIHLSCLGKTYTIHRLIWLMQTGSFPIGVIDHIDGDRLNNKWNNLRDTSQSDNCHNRPEPKHNTSGIKGVWYDKKSQKRQGQIMKTRTNYKTILYETKEKAELALEFLKLELKI